MKKKKTITTKKDITRIQTEAYTRFLTDIKKQVEIAQAKAIFAANKELIKLYWAIGRMIVEKQEESGWGSNIIEKLADDLKHEFPGLAGFSRANIFNMRAFYLAHEKIIQTIDASDDIPFFNIPWWHNLVLITKLKDDKQRIWYAQKAIENGWSRTMLEHWIKSGLFKRDGKAITNFKKTLALPDSDLAQQSLKDPYIFDFLTLQEQHLEQDLERGLTDNVEKLLLEMGKGFALIGRQYHIEVDDKDYYIDLLFYHVKLKCYVVVELKAREFDHRDIGQLNFYLSAVDDIVCDSDDKPTIGLLLCKTKQNLTAEYALRNITSPIGVAEYETEIMKKLPKTLKSNLPTIEEIETEFEKNEMIAELARQAKKPMAKVKAKKTTKKKSS